MKETDKPEIDSYIDEPFYKSLKKTMGAIACLLVYAIAALAVYRDPSTAPATMWPLITLAAALFGIKKYNNFTVGK